MLSYKLRVAAFVALLYVGLAFLLSSSYRDIFSRDNVKRSSLKAIYSSVENQLTQGSALSGAAGSIVRGIRYIAGYRTEGDTILLDTGRLIKNIHYESDTAESVGRVQTEIVALSKKINRRMGVAIVPSGVWAFRDILPPFFTGAIFDERHTIENLYKELGDNAIGIDIYPVFNKTKRESLYMLTEDSITSMAGYYIYRELALRLGYSPARLEDFRIEQLAIPFKGSLWTENIVYTPRTDYISYLVPNENSPLIVSLGRGDDITVYTSLYPLQAVVRGSAKNVILGGEDIQTNISLVSSSAPNRTITILGDSSAYPVLPFLAKHYRDVTFYNLAVQGLPQPGVLGDDILLILSAESLHNDELIKSINFITKNISDT